MESDDKVALLEGLMARAFRDMEREVDLAIERFNRLTPEEQQLAQLRQWEKILGEQS